MPEQSSEVITPQISTKTFVRGAFLFSTQDGTGYEQKNRNRVQNQIVIEDKGNLGGLKRQIQSKRQEFTKKKQKAKKQKQMLIPIRDTPVEPLPEPTMDNNKCERATQQQFQYFQTYISQKQKQRKMQEQQNRRIQLFQIQQQRHRLNEQKQERKSINIVFEKEEPTSLGSVKNVLKKKGPSIKVVIKKKLLSQSQQKNQKKKQDLKESETKNYNIEQKINKNEVKLSQQDQKKDQENKNQKDKYQNHEEQQDFQVKTKIRVVQQQKQ